MICGLSFDNDSNLYEELLLFRMSCNEFNYLQTGPVEGVIFADYGTDLGSGSTVPGMPF